MGGVVRDLKISHRLYGGFAIVLVLLIVAVSTALWQVTGIVETSERIATLRTPTALSAERLTTRVLGTLSALRGYILTGQESFKTERAAAWRDIDAISAEMDRLAPRWTNPNTVRSWADFKSVREEFRAAQDMVEAIADPNDTKPAVALLLSEAIPRGSKLTDIMLGPMQVDGARPGSIVESQARLLKADIEAISSGATTLRLAQGVLLALGVSLGGLIAFLTARGISRPLVDMTKAMGHLAKGDMETEVPAKGRSDEIGDMAEAVEVFKQNAIALGEQSLRFEAAVGNISQGLCMFDRDERLVICNAAYASVYNLPESLMRPGTKFEDIVGYLFDHGISTVGDRGEYVRLRRAEIATGLQSKTIIELKGSRVILALHHPMAEGGWVGTHEDITERRQIEARIEHDALHDALTGLPNRRFLDKVLDERAAVCRGSGASMAVLHVDLDHFKTINDTLGHAAGDAMLIHASAMLRAAVREGDFVGRIGGDEFVVVCGLGGGTRYLARLASRIIAQMRQPMPYEGQACRSGVSIGIAHGRGMQVDGRRLLIKADLALYRAKDQGRNRFEFFTEDLQLQIFNTRRMADEILSGIENGEFIAYYQPQFNSRTQAICGVEALARWQHPTRGLLAPNAFLPVAEERNLVAAIDRMILEQTLQDSARWRAKGLGVPRASVNVSAKRLRDPDLIGSLRPLEIEPGTLAFELVESIYLDENDDMVAWNLDQIRELGIELDIDDFGTGYTSILSLLKLKPQRLKIDRQLVMPIIGSTAQQQLIRSIVEIGHSLGISVVAEGVETLEHAHILAGLWCDELQGYAFSHPLSAVEFECFAAAGNWKAA